MKIAYGVSQYSDYQIYFKVILDSVNLWLFSGTPTITAESTNITGRVIVDLPSELGQSFDFRTYETTISSMNVTLTNGILSNSKTVSEYLYELFYDNLINSKVEVYLYKNSTSTKIYTGFITNLRPSNVYETEFTIDIEDVTRLLTKTALNQNYFDKSSLIADKPTGFSKLARRSNPGFYGAITGLANYDETNSDAVIAGWTDEWWYVLYSNNTPIQHAIYLLEDMGLATSDYYNVSSFIHVEINDFNSVINHFHYEYKEPIDNCFFHMLEQCFRPANCYPVINSSGQLTLKAVKQPSAADVIVDIDESNIVEINSNSNNIQNIVNNAIILYNNDIEENEFREQLYNFDDDTERLSIERFGLLPDGGFSLEIQGLNNNSDLDISNSAFATTLTDYLFNRISTAFKMFSFQILVETAKQIEIGDFINLSHSKLIEWRYYSTKLGQRGLDEILGDLYGKIDISFWGDYSNVYENNVCFSDCQTATEGFWNYWLYIQVPSNKAASYTLTNTLALPIQEELRIERKITLNQFEDILTNYKVNENFLNYHGVI